MSRHKIPAKRPDLFEVIVGYDRPLDEFFAQVFSKQILDHNMALEERLIAIDPESPEYRRLSGLFRDDELIIAYGMEHGTAPLNLSKLVLLVNIYADIGDAVLYELLAERRGDVDPNREVDHTRNA